jgi:hypothetical protein
MAWVAAIPRDGQPANAAVITGRLLVNGEAAIKAFIKEFATPPRNLMELKSYANLHDLDFSGWDGYGQRFDYLRLRNDWYIRSFGSDGRQNTLLSKQDPLVTSINDFQKIGITHGYSDKAARYNPAIRLGTFSPQGNWQAEILTDQLSGASRLLVRNRDRSGYFMISDQNTIEEFYWLPDGYRIVYTVTNSNRYRDGVYLWNLLTDEVVNVFPGAAKLGIRNEESSTKDWYFSLAGIIQTPPTVLVFASPRTSKSLIPENFFSKNNFIGIELPETGEPRILRGSSMSNLYANPLVAEWNPQSDILNCNAINTKESSWCNLKLVGSFQSVLTAWQDFTEKSADSAIFSYSLMLLISLYSDSYALLNDYANDNPEEAEAIRNTEIIRSYGTELAQALSEVQTAPAWLRGFGAYAREQFNSKLPLPYQISKVSIQKDEDLPPFRGQ